MLDITIDRQKRDHNLVLVTLSFDMWYICLCGPEEISEHTKNEAIPGICDAMASEAA